MSGITQVRDTGVHLAAIVSNALPGLKWRHHGIGVLQGYVTEGVEPEIRVHIWHPDLVKDGMSGCGDVHDHRFDMVSHVAAGTVAHEEWLPESSTEGDHQMLRLTHARAVTNRNFHGPTEPIAGRFVVRRNMMMIPAGSTYTFPAGRFHRSPMTGLAVTLVEKHRQQDVSARLLYPSDCDPVMAFGHEMDAGLVSRVIELAAAALSQAEAAS